MDNTTPALPHQPTADHDGHEVFERDVAVLRATLDGDLQVLGLYGMSVPLLVILSGLPGTGKSHFARELTNRVPFLVIESDRLRKVLVRHPQYTAGEHARVFAACHHLIEEYLLPL